MTDSTIEMNDSVPPPASEQSLARRLLPKLALSIALGGLFAWLVVRGGVPLLPPLDAFGLVDWGLVDVFRQHHDEPGLYSWWDYRGGNFHKRMGLRIDLVLATRSLAARSRRALIDRNARKGESPSDHAPVIVDFD